MEKTPSSKFFAIQKALASLRRAALLFTLALLSQKPLAALNPPENLSQYILSNGMAVFVFEDFSAPTVRIEYSARAGFSCQSAATAGYAPLYAELFPRAGLYSSANGDEWLLDGLECECAADSARYTIEASPSQTEEIFSELSRCAFAPLFSDKDLAPKLKEAKNKAAQNAFSAEGFINSAIDSRVFSAAPWKHDSGIYPALFQKQSLSAARSTLAEIARSYYSPQNSALFVTGAVTKEKALSLAEKTFGSFAPGPVVLGAAPEPDGRAKNANKKFVLSDPELSPDMAQAVFQFTSLSMEGADVAAIILNRRGSELKAALTNEASLNIRGSDYINADAAHKNNSNRLIIQSLLEKSAANDFDKAELFEKILRQKIAAFEPEEFEAAKEFLCVDFELNAGNPRGFMELLSQFWAVDGMAKKSWEQSGQEGDASSLVQRFLARTQRIKDLNCEELKFSLEHEEPFAFILLNSKDFQGLASSFKNAGWENVSAKNASWHTQEMFAKIKDSLEQSEAAAKDEGETKIFDQSFFEKSLQSGRTALLKNGMPLHAKTNPASSTSLIGLYIKGGEAQSAQKELGLEAVLASALAQNLQKVCAQKIHSGQMKNAAMVQNQCEDVSALVSLECLAGDEGAAFEALAEALFFSEIVPAEVDVCLSGRKSSQIIKTQAMPRQLYYAGIKNFYKSPLYKALYSSNQDILKNVSYGEILEEYAKILDAGRLEIIAVGNFSFEEIEKKADEVFAGLNSSWKEKELLAQAKPIGKNSQRVKINHTFLTDISADKAGPRPAVLIPTTDFADPVQYWFCAPDDNNEKPLFDALIMELRALCQKGFESSSRYQKMSARIEARSPLISFGAITIFNVHYVSDADAIVQQALAQLKEELAGGEELEQGGALDKIKSLWLKKNFEGADKNLQTALLLAKKIDEARVNGLAFDARDALANDYATVTKADAAAFDAVFEKCFLKFCKFYSADSKK